MAAETFGIGVQGELSPVLQALRRPGLGSLIGVESTQMAKAATQTGTRSGGKLTQAQIDARAAAAGRRRRADPRGAEGRTLRRSTRWSAATTSSVLRLALHMLGNEQDAQDVHQDAFIKAYRHLSNFRFECSFYTWLYRIVTNLCLDQLRRRKSRREDPATVLDSSGEEMDLMANITDDRAMANPGRELDRKVMGERIQRRWTS